MAGSVRAIHARSAIARAASTTVRIARCHGLRADICESLLACFLAAHRNTDRQQYARGFDRTFSLPNCLSRPYEIDAGNYAGSTRTGPVDSSAPATGWSRCDRAEVFGRSSFAGTAG